MISRSSNLISTVIDYFLETVINQHVRDKLYLTSKLKMIMIGVDLIVFLLLLKIKASIQYNVHALGLFKQVIISFKILNYQR